MNTAEALAVLRKSAQSLPIGRRNQVLNRCDRIYLLLNGRTAKQAQSQILDHYSSTRKVVAALIAGRTLSYKDESEFDTSEFHTRICEARRIIARQYPQYTFRAEWAADGRYKLYWLEQWKPSEQ